MTNCVSFSIDERVVPLPSPSYHHIFSHSANPSPRESSSSSPSHPSLTPTLYHEPWWLDAASSGTYREATVTSKDKIIGRLPYVLQTKLGLQHRLVMPTMTHELGPALAMENTPNHPQKSLEVTAELIAQLPAASHIWFRLHPGVTNTFPFKAAGFSCGVDFTVRIEPDAPDTLWRNVRNKTRNVICRAQEQLTVSTINDPVQFMNFYEDNLRSRGFSNRYNRHECEKVMNACVQRGVGYGLVAHERGNGRWKAAMFTAWDRRAQYYLMSTRSLDSGNGAISLLIWATLQDAARSRRVFDLDGVTERTYLLLTSFGGSIQSRLFVHRSTPAFRFMQSTKTIVDAASARLVC
jgi:hypothetical protein